MSGSPYTDEELYRNYLSRGNKESLQCLVERYSDSLLFFLTGIVHSHEDAEDLVIETFAQLLSRDKHFRGESSFKTWLFSIGRNQALKLLRKEHHNHISSTVTTVDNGSLYHTAIENDKCKVLVSSPEDLLIHEEQRKGLHDALDKLPLDYREALFLLYFEDLSYEQIAKIMHKNTKQVTNLIYRGKLLLKKIMS